MAFLHHLHNQQNHHTTTTSCCSSCACQTPPCHHPSPPPLLPSQTTTTDPFLVASIVAQLLQSQNPQNFYPNHIKPTTLNPSQTLNQRHPLPQTHQFHPHFLSSLLQRIDNLESSLHQFSSSNFYPFSLRDAAARVIQTHFRAFLVRRSRTLRQLKALANVKSTLTCLKSSFSHHGFFDFDSVSHKAMDLLLKLDSIQDEDHMIRDSKKSITRDIVQFLELVDGACVKRHLVLTRKIKNMRLVRNDNTRAAHDGRRFQERGGGSKCRNVDKEEKKLIANLRERVEKIGRMSRALQEEEVGDDEIEGVEHVGEEDSDIIDQITGNYKLKKGASFNKNALSSNGKKRVCFVEDGNGIRVYNVEGDGGSTLRDVEEIEDPTKGRQDEEEAQSDGEQSSHSSEDIRSRRSDEVNGNYNHDEEFTFSAPEPPKMEPRADFLTRKPGLKIVG